MNNSPKPRSFPCKFHHGSQRPLSMNSDGRNGPPNKSIALQRPMRPRGQSTEFKLPIPKRPKAKSLVGCGRKLFAKQIAGALPGNHQHMGDKVGTRILRQIFVLDNDWGIFCHVRLWQVMVEILGLKISYRGPRPNTWNCLMYWGVAISRGPSPN